MTNLLAGRDDKRNGVSEMKCVETAFANLDFLLV
jgi:hypothetical protein